MLTTTVPEGTVLLAGSFNRVSGRQTWTLSPRVAEHSSQEWRAFLNLKENLYRHYVTCGYVGDEGPDVAHYNTFFPAERQFSWIIKRGEELIYHKGDMMYCPFPGSDPRIAQDFRPKDELFVPAVWADAVEDLALRGIVELRGHKAKEQYTYYGQTLEGESTCLRQADVLLLVSESEGLHA